MDRGGFYCPSCKKMNMCNCKTCSSLGLNDNEKIVIINESNDDIMICSYCDTQFTYEESLETDWLINIANNYIDRLLALFKDSLKADLDIENYKIWIDNLLVEIEGHCKNEASKQLYINKLQEVLYVGHRLELMIYFKSSIDY